VDDRKLKEVLQLLHKKEVVLLLIGSGSLWKNVCSGLMTVGNHVEQLDVYRKFLNELIEMVNIERDSQCSSIFEVCFHSTRLLLHDFYNIRNYSLSLPSNIKYGLKLHSKNTKKDSEYFALEDLEDAIKAKKIPLQLENENTFLSQLPLEYNTNSLLEDLECLDLSEVHNATDIGSIFSFLLLWKA